MNSFSKSIWSLFAALSFLGCTDDEPKKNSNPNGAEWKKVEIPDNGPVYAIHGDIDDVIQVSVYNRIWKSEDGGESWKKMFTTIDVVDNFKQHGDTLFAITNFTDYYSLTNGDSWESFDKELETESQDLIETGNGIQYRIVYHFDGELALPNELEKSVDTGSNWKSIYPYDHAIYYLAIDDESRLYVGINSSFEWDEEMGWFTEDFENKAAFYYSLSDLVYGYK